jgi:hypothetical protein
MGRIGMVTAFGVYQGNRLNSVEQLSTQRTQRNAEDYSRRGSVAQRARIFFVGTDAREATRRVPSGRPQENSGLVAGRPVSVCRSLRLYISASLR